MTTTLATTYIGSYPDGYSRTTYSGSYPNDHSSGSLLKDRGSLTMTAQSLAYIGPSP